MSQNLPYQNPQQAIIRLLKSQGCCESGHRMVNTNEDKQQLWRYREQLQRKLVQQRNKLNSFPCVITLAEQVEQLKDIVGGLSRQNQDRLRSFDLSTKQFMTRTNQMQQIENQEYIEHERLQGEYQTLLKQLKLVNDTNQHLVNKLAENKINL